MVDLAVTATFDALPNAEYEDLNQTIERVEQRFVESIYFDKRPREGGDGSRRPRDAHSVQLIVDLQPLRDRVAQGPGDSRCRQVFLCGHSAL